MSTTTDNKPDSSKPGDPSAGKPAIEHDTNRTSSRRSGSSSVAGGLALLLSLTALAGTGYLTWLLVNKNPELLEGSLGATTELLIEDNRGQQETLGNHQQMLNELAENQQVIRDAIEQAFSKLGRDRRGWALTETEQLLIIANHRLQLARDIPSAIATLETADQQLRSLADPQLMSVRKAISKEIAQLKELNPVDRVGMVSQLEALMQNTGTLPLSVTTRAQSLKNEMQAGAEIADQGFLQEFWNDVRSLIRIRDNVEQQLPLLPPEQTWFLRENLKLMISGARHALLANDKASFEHSLTTATTWIKTYFDAKAPASAAMLEELDKLAKTDIAISLPDISRSLKTLRSIKEPVAE
ncbi:MAG: uroporphyrinogen-III C-methyltransferase [Gammaproteobacteria bacterium]|nr:uroporphyrinogen-III C-methyltransferase [Gammaproteobacteria bacterium]